MQPSLLDAVIADLESLVAGTLPQVAFYAVVPPARREDGSLTMGWPAYTDRFGRIDAALRAAGYDPAAILDYGDWLDALDGSPDDPGVIARMSADDLSRWAVWSGRGERFCDGFMAGLLAKGLYLAALRRARELGPPPAR